MDVLRLSHAGVSFSPCTAPLSDRHRLITISGSCSPSFGGAGVCITPPDDRGMGYAYIPGSNEAYIYKDPADIVALVLGAGTHGTSGDRLYHYKNRVLSKRLSLAGSVLSRRALLIAQNLEPGHRCADMYSELGDRLKAVSDLAESDYMDFNNMRSLTENINSAMRLHQNLVGSGCDYEI